MGDFYRRRGKRLFDLCVASGALAATSPLQLIAAGAIRWQMGSPVMFRQVRPGLHCAPFTLVKLRTMTVASPGGGGVESDEARLTELGRWLRATSIDELPEIWNVVRGEMSLVGPRPLLMEYLPRYTAEQNRRHDVRPGVTGWAQVSGRNSLAWEEKFALDVWYVDNYSFVLDLRILWRTVTTVFRQAGIGAEGRSTGVEFGVIDGGTPRVV